MKLSRRRFVQTVGTGLVISSLNINASQETSTVVNSPFKHGVASGDPLSDRVILWTRITLDNRTSGVVPVKWRIASDSDLDTIVQEGITYTGAADDFTVKIDPSDLQAATTYYYQFHALGHASPIGRTKTL